MKTIFDPASRKNDVLKAESGKINHAANPAGDS
jgi:hypothetical protein